jgi:cell division initiation protein
MAYTPVELRHVRVKRSPLGYNRTAVKDLLAEIADSFETVWRERHQLADHVETIEGELERLRERERLLTQTLIAAEHAAAEVKEQAKREAELILSEAHSEARSVTRTAYNERQHLFAEARRIEALLRGALGMIEESAEQPEPVAEPPAASPQHQETREFARPEEVEPPSVEPMQLRRVSGGFDWSD